jgi:hypothetical protein
MLPKLTYVSLRSTLNNLFGPFDSLLALDLVLVISRVVDAIDTLLCLGKVHSILVALLSLLLLETRVPCLMGTSLDS